MNYLILVLLFFLFSCSSDKDLVDVEYYMKQGKEFSYIKKQDFIEIKKINTLQLSKAFIISDWLHNKLNTNNDLPRFSLDDFKKKNSIDINTKSFLLLKNIIYLIDENANLIILNENLKELRRKSIYKKKEFEDYFLDFSMTSDGKSIYISDNLGNITCIDIKTLEIKWTTKLGVPIKSEIYLNDNSLFFINSNSKLYSINSLNGKINWSYETASKISKEKYQISIYNNLLITNDDYGQIYCYDLLNKKVLWKLNLDNHSYQTKFKNFKFSNPVVSNGILYLSSNYGETLAIEQVTGKIIWRKLIYTTNLPLVNKDYIFLIADHSIFYILDKKNGDTIYSKDLIKLNINKKNNIIFDNIILGNDYIYFINSSENILKLDLNNLNSFRINNYYIKSPKSFFVLNKYLYILEEKQLSKFYN